MQDVALENRQVAIWGPGSGIEAYYLHKRGADVVAVDSFARYSFPEYEPIWQFYEGLRLDKEPYAEWMRSQEINTYDWIMTFDAFDGFWIELYDECKTIYQTTPGVQLHRILKTGGRFLHHGFESLADMQELYPLQTDFIPPPYENVTNEVKGNSALESALWMLNEFEGRRKELLAVKE